MSVQALDTLRRDLAAKRALGIKWRDMAADYPGVPPGTLCAILKGRKPPKAYRCALGIVTTAKPRRKWKREALWLAGMALWMVGRARP